MYKYWKQVGKFRRRVKWQASSIGLPKCWGYSSTLSRTTNVRKIVQSYFKRSSTFSGGRPKTARWLPTAIGRSFSLGCVAMVLIRVPSSSNEPYRWSALNSASPFRINWFGLRPIIPARDRSIDSSAGFFKYSIISGSTPFFLRSCTASLLFDHRELW